MITLTDIEERVQFWPDVEAPIILPEVRALCVLSGCVEVADQIGTLSVNPGDSFVLAALIDSGRYALVVDPHRTGPELQWTDSVFLIASNVLRLLPS